MRGNFIACAALFLPNISTACFPSLSLRVSFSDNQSTVCFVPKDFQLSNLDLHRLMTCDVNITLTVFQSYQDDGRVLMVCNVQ